MNRFSIASRLAALLSVLLALLAIAVVSAVVRAGDARRAAEAQFHDGVETLAELHALSRALERDVAGASDTTRAGASLARLRQALQRGGGAADVPPALGTLLSAAERALAAATAAPADADAAQALRRSGQSLERPLEDWIERKVDAAARADALARATYETIFWRNVLVLGTVLAAAAFASVAITRSIVRPIRDAVRVAETVASGDLGARIDVRGRDECAQLMQALSRMNAALGAIVSQVRTSADSIAIGSSQIAIGNADLSQRTEEQAGSLQQTNASIEQLRTTVQANSGDAVSAARRARQASDLAQQGGQLVEQSVQRMALISGSSRRITDIIGTIDDLAFQTNILALNAAVEAARAGEQGRGFAVVAGEVRSLAKRSAQAAHEIKGLIDESSKAVDGGVALIGAVGRTIGEAVAEVEAVNGFVQEISEAGQAQASDMAAIAGAVAQIDSATQQNAALVEQSAAAAESLRRQAENLVGAVKLFRLSAAA